MRVFTIYCLLLWASVTVAQAQNGGLDYLLKAEELKKNNNLRGAIDEYNKAIAADPANPEYVFRKGQAYVVLKDADNAIQCFQKTVELKNDYLGAHTRLAKLFVLKNKVNDAIAAYDNAFKLEANAKEKAEYKINIIKLLYKDGRFKEATNHINDALAADPGNLNALYYHAKLSNQQGKPDEAVKSMLKATGSLTSTDPKETARFYFELGLGLYNSGKYPEANAAFAKANFGPYRNRIFEMTPSYFLGLGTAYFKAWELDEAKTMLDQALKIKPDFTAAHEVMIKISQAKTDKSAIAAQLKKAAEAEKDPIKKGNLYAQIAQQEFESGKFAEAIASADACLAVQAPNYNVGFIKAVSLARSGKLNDGINLLSELLKNPGLDQETKAMFNFAQGLMYNKANNTKLANMAFKRAEFGNYKFASVVELRKNNDETLKSDDLEDTTLSDKNLEN